MKSILIAFTFALIFTNCTKNSERINYRETSLYIEHASTVISDIGFIFYPGALIEARAYNTWHRELAQKGFRVFSVKFPASLAILDVNAALRIINQNKGVDKWFIGGHSLGGAMAMQLLSEDKNLSLFEGIVLYGAYPGSNIDLSDKNLNVLSLYGSEDGISTVEEIEEGRSRLPEGVEMQSFDDFSLASKAYYFLIEGGNHSYFGKYGNQQGDGTPQITREEQQKIMVDFSAAFFNTFVF